MVAKHEPATFGRMSVEINIHSETLVLFSLLYNGLSRSPNRRMIALGGSQVHSIKITRHGVESVVAARYPIGIEHHDHLEYEVLPQTLALLATHIGQQLEQAVQDVTTWGLTRVHSRRQKDAGFLATKPQRSSGWLSFCLRKQTMAICWNSLSFQSHLISRANRQKLHRAPLQRIVQDLAIKVDIVLILQFSLNFICQLQRVFVAERKSEGEVGRSRLRISEYVIEAQAKLLFNIQKCRNFVKDPSPLFLLSQVMLDSKHRSEPLVVQFLL